MRYLSRRADEHRALLKQRRGQKYMPLKAEINMDSNGELFDIRI